MATETTLVVAPDHPALPGHFPGHPVVPGVLLLGHVLAALARIFRPGTAPDTGPAAARLVLTAIPQAKFLAPLAPGEACTIAFPALGRDSARFECRSGARVIARGTLKFRTDAGDAR